MREEKAIQVIVNPVSGRGKAGRVVAELCDLVRDSGWTVAVVETKGPGDAREAVRGACQLHVRAVVVVGGDGTIREAVCGLEGAGVPLAVIPCGTENILAKHLGLKRNARQLWNILQNGREVAVDVPAMNGNRFLLLAGVGFDADIVHRLSACRKGPISYATYFKPVWQSLWNFKFPELQVEVDGTRFFSGSCLLFIGNVPRYAMGVRLWPGGRIDDGLLDVCVLPCRGVASLLPQGIRAILTKELNPAKSLQGRGKKIRVWSSEPVPVQFDGDPAGGLPVEIEMTSLRARFLVEEL